MATSLSVDSAVKPSTPVHGNDGVVRMGVIGYGYWGPNIVRNFHGQERSRVVAICDKTPKSLQRARQAYPEIRAVHDCNDILSATDIDAIAIVTPVWTHYELAKIALENGKHVFVEKPFTCTTTQAEELIELAERKKLKIMVEHTFLFTGAVKRIKEFIDNGTLGDLYYYDSTRVNLGLFQHDVNVLWDLAVHDLSIMDAILGRKPTAVAATGISNVPGRPINPGYLPCFFEGNLLAHFHVNWLAPVKIRRTLIGGDAQMIVYDDLEPSEKVKIYDRGITVDAPSEAVYELMVGYRVGDMWAPQVSL